jgi:hypothetical protein
LLRCISNNSGQCRWLEKTAYSRKFRVNYFIHNYFTYKLLMNPKWCPSKFHGFYAIYLITWITWSHGSPDHMDHLITWITWSHGSPDHISAYYLGGRFKLGLFGFFSLNFISPWLPSNHQSSMLCRGSPTLY